MTMTQASVVVALPCELVRAGANDRTVFDRPALEALAASIACDGLLQPITVRPVGGGYEIVAGERRFRAVSEVLGWATVDAIVRELDGPAASRAMLVENVVRVDLDPVAEARAYDSRMREFGLSVGEVAAWASVTPARVASRLPVLRLCPEAQELVRVGALSINHAKVLAPLTVDFQVLAVRTLAERDLSYLAFRDLCASLEAQQAAQSMFDPDAFLQLVDDVEAARDQPVADVVAASDLLDSEELAALLGLKAATLRTMRAQPGRHRSIDGLPAPLRTISGRPVWSRRDVDAWLAAKRDGGTPAV